NVRHVHGVYGCGNSDGGKSSSSGIFQPQQARQPECKIPIASVKSSLPSRFSGRFCSSPEFVGINVSRGENHFSHLKIWFATASRQKQIVEGFQEGDVAHAMSDNMEVYFVSFRYVAEFLLTRSEIFFRGSSAGLIRGITKETSSRWPTIES